MIIGACGIVCSECGAYKATQANDAAEIAKVAANWSELYNTDIKPEYVWCDSCLSDGDRKCGHCRECNIRACVTEHKIANCSECSDYGCEKISEFIKAVPDVKAVLDDLRAKND